MDMVTPGAAEPFAEETTARVSAAFPLVWLISGVDTRRSGALVFGREARVSPTFSGTSPDMALGTALFRRSAATFRPPSLSVGRLVDPLRLSGFGCASKKIPAGRPSGLWIKTPEEADPPNGFADFEKYSRSSNANGEAARGCWGCWLLRFSAMVGEVEGSVMGLSFFGVVLSPGVELVPFGTKKGDAA